MESRYRPRRFDQSPLFKVVYSNFEAFQAEYQFRYSESYGFFRRIITHTVERYLLCGDPREGVARYECPRCGQSRGVPFSCKTRLFCPSCHEKKILLWLEAIRTEILLPVPHRFWTFSIPKMLRPYFMRNRKLLSLLVTAANNALVKSLSGGKLPKGIRPGIIALIQTHSDSLDWNCHLHLIVTNGLVDYRDPKLRKFKVCKYWDVRVIAEIFRYELILSMVKKKVLAPEVADNLLSWRHSGFNVHATAPFDPSDAQLLENRLAYAFRPPVALNRLSYDGETMTVITSKRKELSLTPLDFLAKLTLHIPNRYQNIRRYAGFYASNIQRGVRAAREKGGADQAIEESSSFKPKWAIMIAKIFGTLPIACPKCGTTMELKEFIFGEEKIQKFFPEFSRAPPRKVFDDALLKDDGTRYVPINNTGTSDADINQLRPESDDDFNQDINW